MAVEHVSRTAFNLCNHVRLRMYTAGHHAVSIRKLQQGDFGGAESRSVIAMQRGSDAKVSRGVQDGIDSDVLNNPNGDGVSGLRQSLPDGDDAFELIVKIRDPLRRLVSRGVHRDGLVRHRSIEIQSALTKCSKIHNRLHSRTWLAHGLGYAIEVAVRGDAASGSSPPAGLGQDGRVPVPQNDDGALNQPGILRMTLFIEIQAVFECGVCKALDPIVNR